LSHATYYYLLYCAAFLLVLVLGWFTIVPGYELRQLEVRDYTVQRCDFLNNPGGPVLQILDAVYMEELGLIDSWCHAPEIAQYFGSLELRRVHRDRLDLRDFYESRYDLILAKQELMDGGGQVRKDGIGYELIADYADYGSQLVSLQGTPELSEAWLSGKRLGLLDDPNSVSAYQIPKAALRDSGLENLPEIVYFRSYRQMYKALFEGRVDVIATLFSEEGPDSALQLPPGLVLEATIQGPAWYVDRELMQGPGYCELLAALEELARNARVDYFRDLRIVHPCNAN
jgi:hypothetical protein